MTRFGADDEGERMMDLDEARGALALYDEDGFLDNNDLQRVMPVVRWALGALANGERVEPDYEAARGPMATMREVSDAEVEAIAEAVFDLEANPQRWSKTTESMRAIYRASIRKALVKASKKEERDED